MKELFKRRVTFVLGLTIAFLTAAGILPAHAVLIPGISGTSPNPVFNLTVKPGTIVTDEGNSVYMWGYADGINQMQYPGPTLIVNQNDNVTVNLTNQLSVPVSILFPGQQGVNAAMVAGTGNLGLLTLEANPGETVQYTFTASQPGTYTYYSGTRPELQVEMGLVGALIVRPSFATPVGFAGCGYGDAASCFQQEYLHVLSEIDPRIHLLVQQGRMTEIDNSAAAPVYWFINGRAGFDTVAPNNSSFFPRQPYSALVRTHPGETVLLRIVGATRDLHPHHLHGNHHRVIARDGRLLGAGANLREFAFTTTVGPGQTFDSLFTWTGQGLGWDIYGHTGPAGEIGQACVNAGVPLEPNESLADHCRALPVVLPDNKEMTFGPLYTGSPFLGSTGNLPPGEGGFNPNAGLPFMWHSHSEKELTSNNIFPGGMLTFCIIEHPSVPIP
jgi:manganese oxidase